MSTNPNTCQMMTGVAIKTIFERPSVEVDPVDLEFVYYLRSLNDAPHLFIGRGTITVPLVTGDFLPAMERVRQILHVASLAPNRKGCSVHVAAFECKQGYAVLGTIVPEGKSLEHGRMGSKLMLRLAAGA
jgi:hypothetical protein